MSNSINYGKSRKAKTYKKASKAAEIANSKNGAYSQKNAEQNSQTLQETEVTPEEKIVRRAYEIAPEWKLSIIETEVHETSCSFPE